MTTSWLSGARVRDLSRVAGYGPFGNFLGVVLHVNDADPGTNIDYWYNNPDQVTPNFQVWQDGSIDQMLPVNWQPWCQENGNETYAAIETAGLATEALTDAQIGSIAAILRVYHDELGMPYELANAPGERGFGVHYMGGIAWGGHSCPGTIRAGQRQAILDMAMGVEVADIPQAQMDKLVGEIRGAASYVYGNPTKPDPTHGAQLVSSQQREELIISLLQRLVTKLGA